MHKILVTGGCGFIGSHTIVDLVEHGYEVVSIDNLVNAYPRAMAGIEKITGVKVPNYEVDLCDATAVEAVFQQAGPFDGVVHIAALKAVGESVKKPLWFYQNNIASLLVLLQTMDRHQVKPIIFSSSCSVYGNITELPVTERNSIGYAESPYAYTKQVAERMIQDVAQNQGTLQAVLLRYFNPAGAHPSGHIGERSRMPSLNLVPVICEAAAGKRAPVTIFGDDYPTRDGSCVRDYIHIMDLARAHTLAMDRVLANKPTEACEVFNLGIGAGVTVLEVVRAFEKVTGITAPHHVGPRRPGDVMAVYADKTKATNVLGWNPQYDIEDIMRTAWKWEQEGW